MARKPNVPQKGKPARIHLILPGDLVIKIDAMRVKLAVPGDDLTRSDVIRRAVYAFVK